MSKNNHREQMRDPLTELEPPMAGTLDALQDVPRTRSEKGRIGEAGVSGSGPPNQTGRIFQIRTAS